MERTVWNNRLIDGAKLDAISLNGSWKIDTTSLANWSVSDAELQTLNWITWNIQEQIDNIKAWGWGWGWVILNPRDLKNRYNFSCWLIYYWYWIKALDWITWNIEVRLDNLEWTIYEMLRWNHEIIHLHDLMYLMLIHEVLKNLYIETSFKCFIDNYNSWL